MKKKKNQRKFGIKNTHFLGNSMDNEIPKNTELN